MLRSLAALLVAAFVASSSLAEPRKVWEGTVDKSGVRVEGPISQLMIRSLDAAAGRIYFGPTPDADYDFLEAGQTFREHGTWDAIWLRAGWSTAEVQIWADNALASKTDSPKIGTTFKGGRMVELAEDGTAAQVSTTVAGTHGLTLAQDPRNDPSTVIWITTHIDLRSDQRTSDGKPLPSSGPPGGVDKRFPLLYGQYLEVEGFNNALWAWAEPGQGVGPIRIYYVKHAFGL
jgi:hypothetical protein